MPAKTGRIPRKPAILSQLNSDRVRSAVHDGQRLYALNDVIALLAQTDHPAEYWATLVRKDAALRHLPTLARWPEDEQLVAIDLPGVFRIAQVIPGTRTESLRHYIAAIAVERLEESDDPELAILRVRREYERRGYPRQWIDQRMRAISARGEIVSEWHKRGARDAEDYRALTNTLMTESFGMDVETYRQFKGLFEDAPRENLRDQMTELELALLSLAETLAADLHRIRGSHTLPALEQDMHAAGAVVANTLWHIEHATGKPVVEPARRPFAERRNPPESNGREIVYRREHSTDAPDQPHEPTGNGNGNGNANSG